MTHLNGVGLTSQSMTRRYITFCRVIEGERFLMMTVISNTFGTRTDGAKACDTCDRTEVQRSPVVNTPCSFILYLAKQSH